MRIAIYTALAALVYLATVYIESHELNSNAQDFNVLVICADQSEACEDALEDLQANIID